MSWSTPGTAVSGALIPASFWNSTYENDFSLTGAAQVIYSGDTFAASGANNIVVIPSNGAVYQVLRVNSAASQVEYGLNPPSALIYANSAVQSIPTATETVVTFDTTDFNYDSMANIGTNNDRLTCNTAGYYLIFFTAALEGGASSSTYEFQGRIGRYNSSNTLLDYYIIYVMEVNSDPCYINASGLIQLSSGDYIKLLVTQNFGSTKSLAGSGRSNGRSLSAVLVAG